MAQKRGRAATARRRAPVPKRRFGLRRLPLRDQHASSDESSTGSDSSTPPAKVRSVKKVTFALPDAIFTLADLLESDDEVTGSSSPIQVLLHAAESVDDASGVEAMLSDRSARDSLASSTAGDEDDESDVDLQGGLTVDPLNPRYLDQVNLRCMQSIKAYCKLIKVKFQLQPTADYRMTNAKLDQYVRMSKKDQEKAKKDFFERYSTTAKRNQQKMLIPGDSCGCCKLPKAPVDDPPNESIEVTVTEAAQVVNDQGNDGDGDDQAYRSQGHNASDRPTGFAQRRKTERKAQRTGPRVEFARTVQTQYGQEVRDAARSLFLKGLRVMTASTVAPEGYDEKGYPILSQKEPRNRFVILNLNGHAENSPNGGVMKNEKRAKPLLTVFSSSPDDMKEVIKVYNGFKGVTYRDYELQYDTEFILGVGRDFIQSYQADIEAHKAGRSRKHTVRTAADVLRGMSAPFIDGLTSTVVKV